MMLEKSDEILKKITSIKNDFLAKRKKIEVEFFKNKKGLECCKKNSDLTDLLIRKIFFIIKGINNFDKNFLICAVGGYGRKHLAPFSDIDLLFAYDQKISKKELRVIIEFILYSLWDIGLKIGYAVRTFEEINLFSKKDQVIKTSILDARVVFGSKLVFNKIMRNFVEEFTTDSKIFLKEKICERKKSIQNLGFDYFKNEPNLKESEGSLRDINLIYWGLKILNISQKKNIKNSNKFLNLNEKKKISKALEFLLTLRCFAHYLSKRQNDKLTFDLQKTIAEKIRTKEKRNTNNLVELLMRDYFEQIKKIKTLTQILSESIFIKLSKNVRLAPRKLTKNYKLSLFKNIFNNKFTADDLRLVINNLSKIKKTDLLTKENLKYFKKILFSKVIHKFLIINDIGLLGKIIPEFSQIDNLPQFDRFHALSVGQHTLKALSILKNINSLNCDLTYKFANKIMNEKNEKISLFYAVLLHDIGKGLGGEHTLKGAVRAKKIISKLNEDQKVVKECLWLIKNHLLLSEFAFKKDIEDDSVVKKVCQEINTVDRLNGLYLLTVADISAVDHGIWNEWKAKLLETLYLKIQDEILKPNKSKSLNDKIKVIKEKVYLSSKLINKKRIENFSKITYPSYWLLQSENAIRFQIENFFLNKKKTRFDFFIKKIGVQNFLEVTIVTNDRPSLFLDLITAFLSENLSVHEARIFTLDDGIIIDTFIVSSNLQNKYIPDHLEEKIDSMNKKLNDLKNNKIISISNIEFKKKKRLLEKIEINFDNFSSATYTVLEVITNDRPGLLFNISKVLLKNKLVISMAKISTNGDFVEDSFHLRNEFGMKIDNEFLISELKKEISKSILRGLMDVS